ncbi:MAG: hypothetical protein GWP19_14045 [Planctomycetia bacterium]|nr:hypothetical protein [Planctomycetia bacterium]
MDKKAQRKTDWIELLIVLAIVFLIIAIYVPVAIWADEDHFEELSHSRMQNIYDIERFYAQLTNEYDQDGYEAMNIVNAIADSVTADSNYVGEQKLNLLGKVIDVNVPVGFGVEFDTTFGFQKFRRDTTMDTTATVIMYSEELSRNDTIFVQKKEVANLQEDPAFRGVINEEPLVIVSVESYYDKYQPDSTQFLSPIINKPYILSFKEDGFRVDSPIKETYVKRKYLVFAFKADNQGYIEDGVASWD